MTLSSLAEPQFLSLKPPLARRQLRALIEDAGWHGDVESALLAVHEALVNSQRHGGGVTRVCAGLEGRSLIVEVCDRGPGFDLGADRVDPPEPMAERGRGMWLMQRIASDCRLHHQGDGVCLSLRFDAP